MVIKIIMAMGVQMTHEVVFQAGDNCGDSLDENDQEQAEEWFVHGVSLVVNVDRRCAFLLFLYQERRQLLEVTTTRSVSAQLPALYLAAKLRTDPRAFALLSRLQFHGQLRI